MKKHRYAINYIPRLREKTVRTADINKYIARMLKGDVQKIYSVIDLTTYRKIEIKEIT